MSDRGTDTVLNAHMDELTALLNDGQVLEALKTFYAENARVYENGYLFADGRDEAVARQRPFIEPCTWIEGDLSTVYTDLGRGISVLHNRTRFDHPDYGSGQIDGVHVYYWQGGMVTREEYFSGEQADEALRFWGQLAKSRFH